MDTPQRTEQVAKQVAKQEIGGVKTGARKFESKVFKNWWTRGGHRFEAEDYSFRIAHNGRRETVSLLTPDMREAARRAARFHYVLKVNGWDAAFADLSPEVARVASSPTSRWGPRRGSSARRQ